MSDTISSIDEMTIGSTYRATVDRISSSGNGIVSLSDGHVNLGPMDEDRVGDTVRIECVGKGSAELVTNTDSNENPVGRDPTDNKNDLLGGHQ